MRRGLGYVVVTTGYGGDGVRVRLARAGMRCAIVSKPFSLEAIGLTVHRVAGGDPSPAPGSRAS